ncbi:MurR/RpiR family transcriptional regulator [Aeromicrobium sp. YIM 150415]|uniref:MurR/RpiR family transcriptional regulator n=1 Tax=Aeromicrobium sp. YIM 150415 TaxID=2803912 RepID=UPI001963C99B|nr:MurR/RpiR family transcriptional regulator [Aeromicrobium sp. YIM 150415]MBM9463389.1 MurR/RpiR family transcriptional regulator [Aeromicrobium sp. YIM 150415]
MTVIPDGHSSVRSLLYASMDTLSDSERRVGRALLAQYPSAGLTTVAELAGIAGVSPPTVIRFVNRLGFTGFPALQRALVHELNGELGSPLKQYPEKTHGQGEPSSLGHHGEAFASMLSTTFDEVPVSEFASLVRLLSDPSRQVRIAGGRFSRVLADYTAMHLQILRAGVEFVRSEDIDQRTAIADSTSSTVLVVYDYRRYSDVSLRLARQMSERGATICLFTDNWLSPIAKFAKVVLPSRVDSASPFDSLMAAMAVSEAAIGAVADHLGEQGVRRLSVIESSLDTH